MGQGCGRPQAQSSSHLGLGCRAPGVTWGVGSLGVGLRCVCISAWLGEGAVEVIGLGANELHHGKPDEIKAAAWGEAGDDLVGGQQAPSGRGLPIAEVREQRALPDRPDGERAGWAD